MITYQDYLESTKQKTDFVLDAIRQYQVSSMYRTACIADEYEEQRNTTITNCVKYVYKISGEKVVDFTSSNSRIASNFFHRLNTQRCTYSLGNGIEFAKKGIKERFGKSLDTIVNKLGYDMSIHGNSYAFVSDDLYEFKATEFVPLYDEQTGVLRAGIRFWKPAPDKPLTAVFYEEDGFTKYREAKDGSSKLIEFEKKKAYIQKIQKTEAFGVEVVGEGNYSALPIIPCGKVGNPSTLVGMRASIDAYDLVRSGFANDINDCAQIYWLIENYGGMNDEDVAHFIDRLKLNHAAVADTSQGGRIAPVTQEIPYNARKIFLDDMRAGIYEDFGGLDVHTISAGATNDEIQAAYQPLDENADAFEYAIIQCVQGIGAVLGIPADDCVPIFKRNRISNQLELVQMITASAQWLDDETIVSKLPFITTDEVEEILKRKAAEDMDKVQLTTGDEQEESEEEST